MEFCVQFHLRWSSGETGNAACTISNPTVGFCCNLLTHDRKEHRWREAMRPPVVQDCSVSISFRHLCTTNMSWNFMWPDWVCMCLHPIREAMSHWTAGWNHSICLAETIRTLGITLHQDAASALSGRGTDLWLPDITYILLHTPTLSSSSSHSFSLKLCLLHSHCS